MLTSSHDISIDAEIIHGAVVPDPYRWLEDRFSTVTDDWLIDQREAYSAYFRTIGPLGELDHRVIELLNVEQIDQIGKVGNLIFFRRRGRDEAQPSICVSDSNGLFERKLVVPAPLGEFVWVGIHRISSDGGLLAYELKSGGEHSKAIYVVDVKSGVTLSDGLSRGVARGFTFSSANDGFYYCHDACTVTTPSEHPHTIRFHKFGTDIADDDVIFASRRTDISKLVLKSDGKLLFAAFSHGKDGTSVVDIYTASQTSHDEWRCIVQDVPLPFGPFAFRDRLFAHHFDNSPNGSIVEFDLFNPPSFRVVVPEWRIPIEQCVIAMERIYVVYLDGTDTIVRIWSVDGKYLGTLSLERGYSWRLLPGHSNHTDELFIVRESFVSPPALLRYGVRKNAISLWKRSSTPPPRHALAIKTMTYQSTDGVDVDISIVGRQDLQELNNRPLIMTAYGGFGLTLTPQYSAFVTVLLELGFVFALPQIRGGWERGREWHEEVRKRSRQIIVDDFIAAADWLCETGFTNPAKMAVFGGSNSGLLVGAAITQRPDLFRAALCIAPLLDMVRYHLFDRACVWASEYGTSESPADLKALLSYSPYHRVCEDVDYPATLFVCGDQDTRCNPAHSRKMVARLQNRPAQRNPILLDHRAERGHSPTMPLSVRIESLTHRLAFLCHELGVAIPQRGNYGPTGD